MRRRRASTVQVTTSPLTSASRGVALWLGTTVVVIAGLTAAALMRPAFPNEPPVVAGGFLLGAIIGAWGIQQGEPRKAAIAWLLVNVVFAAVVLVFPVALGLA